MKILKKLPLQQNVETEKVLKKLSTANRALGELKGLAWNIPDSEIYLNSLGLLEVKSSTALDNFNVSLDDVFKRKLGLDGDDLTNAQEVLHNFSALKKGYGLVTNTGLITEEHINAVQAELEGITPTLERSEETISKNPSLEKLNQAHRPQPATIKNLLSNLEEYMNGNPRTGFDPLVDMAIVQYQFESIQPFKNRTGRTARIISLLYLIANDLVPIPVLYMSKYIFAYKHEYYKLLREVRNTGQWENWLLFMLDCVELTALEAISKINRIQLLISGFEGIIRQKYKFYSPQLITNLFLHPYTTIELIEKDLKVSRITAAKYLNTLAKDGFLTKKYRGTANYYINAKLVEILA